MTRPLQILLGPEMLWIVIYLAVSLLVKFSSAPIKSMDATWLSMAWIIPLAGMLLTFSFYFIPGIEHNWLWLRVWIAGLLGAHYALEKALKAHTEQGPGVGTAYLMGMIFVIIMLIIGSIFIKLKF